MARWERSPAADGRSALVRASGCSDARRMTIVVGVDGSAPAQHALDWAIREARVHDCALQLVHGAVVVGGHAITPSTARLVTKASALLLDRVLAVARTEAPDLAITAALVRGPAALGLIDASADADLLVVGSHGHGGATSFVLGSVADACVRHAAVPVAVIRPEAVAQSGGAVVVGVDGSEGSLAALRWARCEAFARGSGLDVIHAWDAGFSTELAAIAVGVTEEIERDARATLHSAVELTAGVGTEAPTEVLVHDFPERALLEAANDATLLVVGSRGRGGFTSLLLGSVSRSCVHRAGCPVVVVREPATG